MFPAVKVQDKIFFVLISKRDDKFKNSIFSNSNSIIIGVVLLLLEDSTHV